MKTEAELRAEEDLARRKIQAVKKALTHVDELREELVKVQDQWEERLYRAQDSLTARLRPLGRVDGSVFRDT